MLKFAFFPALGTRSTLLPASLRANNRHFKVLIKDGCLRYLGVRTVQFWKFKENLIDYKKETKGRKRVQKKTINSFSLHLD